MRTCLFCRHFSTDYDPGLGCPTCGYEASFKLRCGKQVFYGEAHSNIEFFSIVNHAIACEHYDELSAEEVRAKGEER